MEIGDKICCNKNTSTFRAGISYEIINRHTNSVLLKSEHNSQWFNLTKTVAYGYPTRQFLFDYFSNIKEVRKLKLKKINESR